MINPETKKEFTEVELLHVIMEDAGRLSTIENTLKERGEGITIYDTIIDIETRAFDILNVLLSIKRLLTALTCLVAGIALLLFIKFFF
jgi:hypothetical protein